VRKLYVWNTRVGPFYIAERGGWFHPIFDDESLGSYATPQHAVDDLAGGHTYSAGVGIDTAALGIPDDVNEWDSVGR
jgi:hypothetical protein